MGPRALALGWVISLGCKGVSPVKDASRVQARGVAEALARVEGCLLGPWPIRGDRAAVTRARRMALGRNGDWPADCLPALRALRRVGAPGALSAASVQSLEARISNARPQVEGFVFGREDGDAAVAWTPELLALHRTVSVWLNARGIEAQSPVSGARIPLSSVTLDLSPMPLGDRALRVASVRAEGTLTVLFRDEGAAVACRTRDRGATLRCARLSDDGPRGALRELVPHDRAEALGVFERAGSFRIEALDVPERTAFLLPGGWLSGRVDGEVLHALVRSPQGLGLWVAERSGSARGSASSEATTRFAGGEGAALFADRNSLRFTVLAPTVAHDSPALGAQTFGSRELRWVAALGLGSVKIASCEFGGVGYVAATDGERTQVLRVEGATVAVLGGFALRGTVRLACDLAGLSLWAGESVASCTAQGACGEISGEPGLLDLTRHRGELLGVARGARGALRILRGHAGEALVREALADDAEHGGISAERAWMERVDGGAVLMTHGAVGAVLFSPDGGVWRSAREVN